MERQAEMMILVVVLVAQCQGTMIRNEEREIFKFVAPNIYADRVQ